MDNVDADILAAVYNRAHPYFSMHIIQGGTQRSSLLSQNPRGSRPSARFPRGSGAHQLRSRKSQTMASGISRISVGVLPIAPPVPRKIAESSPPRLQNRDGHRKERSLIQQRHRHLQAILPGERVLKFGLLPNLRVTRVTDEQGQNLHFIQESRKEDGSFYVVLSQALPSFRKLPSPSTTRAIRVLENAGDGSFYFRARTSWYPNLNGFGEHALYDLTFKVPHKYTVVSVGQLKRTSIEGDFGVSHWVTPIPVAVAGFNYGEYTRLELADDITHYRVSGYYLKEFQTGCADASAPDNGSRRDDEICARANPGPVAAVHILLRQEPLRGRLRYRAA